MDDIVPIGSVVESAYDVAQVCLKGHVITERYVEHPEARKDFCTECGQKTIFQCQHCKFSIQGRYKRATMFLVHPEPDKYCYHCGKPYPWTERKLRAARSVIEEAEARLTQQQQGEFLEAFEDIMRDVSEKKKPEAAAVAFFKKYSAKVGDKATEQLVNILISGATTSAVTALKHLLNIP